MQAASGHVDEEQPKRTESAPAFEVPNFLKKNDLQNDRSEAKSAFEKTEIIVAQCPYCGSKDLVEGLDGKMICLDCRKAFQRTGETEDSITIEASWPKVSPNNDRVSFKQINPLKGLTEVIKKVPAKPFASNTKRKTNTTVIEVNNKSNGLLTTAGILLIIVSFLSFVNPIVSNLAMYSRLNTDFSFGEYISNNPSVFIIPLVYIAMAVACFVGKPQILSIAAAIGLARNIYSIVFSIVVTIKYGGKLAIYGGFTIAGWFVNIICWTALILAGLFTRRAILYAIGAGVVSFLNFATTFIFYTWDNLQEIERWYGEATYYYRYTRTSTILGVIMAIVTLVALIFLGIGLQRIKQRES